MGAVEAVEAFLSVEAQTIHFNFALCARISITGVTEWREDHDDTEVHSMWNTI